jgi:hypothetical protein
MPARPRIPNVSRRPTPLNPTKNKTSAVRVRIGSYIGTGIPRYQLGKIHFLSREEAERLVATGEAAIVCTSPDDPDFDNLSGDHYAWGLQKRIETRKADAAKSREERDQRAAEVKKRRDLEITEEGERKKREQEETRAAIAELLNSAAKTVQPAKQTKAPAHRPPYILERIKEEMRELHVEVLKRMTVREMADKFKASRGRCSDARAIVLGKVSKK